MLGTLKVAYVKGALGMLLETANINMKLTKHKTYH
jgi:hypothetical protein